MPVNPEPAENLILLAWYDRMEAFLVEEMVHAVRGSYQWARAQSLLMQIRAQVALLLQQAGPLDDAALRTHYQQGLDAAFEMLREIEGLPEELRPGMTLPYQALQALARDAAGQRVVFLRGILRQSRDYLRSLAAGEIAQGLGLGKDSYAVGKAIREGLIDAVRRREVAREIAGQIMTATGVIYTDGSVHSLHAYGQMAGRTGMANAIRQAQLDAYDESGIVHLVKIPTNGTLCYRCLPFEGRVFAIDAIGEAMGYPPLSVWRANGWHPACRHTGVIPIIKPTPRDRPPEKRFVNASHTDLYAWMRDEHDDLYRASRQGFATLGEWEQWRRANPGIPVDQLRGPRWRYAGIESRRQDAITEMLLDGDLHYADAVSRQTAVFMESESYQQQRPIITPAAQRRRAERIAP